LGPFFSRSSQYTILFSFFTSKGLDKYNRFSDDFVVRSFDPEKCFFHPFFFFLYIFYFFVFFLLLFSCNSLLDLF